jgi:hypothetical protein
MNKTDSVIWGNKLPMIKTFHTIIWLFFNTVLFYMAYAVIINRINIFVWLGIGCILIEWLVLLIFKWQCPFTILARKYSSSSKENFDIFLPIWLAKYNKPIYITIFIIIITGLFFRTLNK